MSKENVELVTNLQPAADVDIAELFRNDDIWSALADAIAPFFRPDFESVAPGVPGTERVHVGLDGLRAAWLEWIEPWLTYRTEIEQVIDAGDRVLLLTHDYGRREGVAQEVKVDGSAVWTVGNGKIVRACFYTARSEAFAAAGCGILTDMAEESRIPDLVELGERIREATVRRDLDAIMAFFTADAVWDASPMGIGTFEGQAAIRGFWEDWISSYEDFELQTVEAHDLGNGVSFGVAVQRGRLLGSSGQLELRYAAVNEWEDGKIARITNYTDIDEARAAAERLTQERA